MQRFFGKKRAGLPEVTLDDAAASMDGRSTTLEQKVKKLDQELLGYKKSLAAAKTPGAKNLLKQKAMRVIKQRKMYEKQLESLQNQQFNVDQTRLTQQSLVDSAQMVAAMKTTSKQLKTTFKTINLAEVEDLRDDMEDLLADADEMNEILGQSYGVPDDIDENDLLNELDMLDDEMELNEEVPDYLVEAALPSVDTNAEQVPAQVSKAPDLKQYA